MSGQPVVPGSSFVQTKRGGVFLVLLLLAVLSTGVVLGLAIRPRGISDTSGVLDMARSYMKNPLRGNQAYGSEAADAAIGMAEPALAHINMTDDAELLWRASSGGARELRPPNTPRKVAFLFLTRGPMPLGRVWERFFRGYEGMYSIYLHASPAYESKNDADLSPLFQGRYIPSKPVLWGDITVVEAERRLLAHALLDIYNERFVLVSESCIPVVGFLTLYEYLITSPLSFIALLPEDSGEHKNRWSENMLPEVPWEDWQKSAQWFDMDRSVAMVIVAETTLIKKFAKFCEPDRCYSDEHYIPTLLYLTIPHKLGNRTLTWTDWTHGGPHPTTFGADGITPGLIKHIKTEAGCVVADGSPGRCYLFARKFAGEAVENLLALGEDILGY